jgi:CMP-N,N'-diacetyllegionaminic acid synthase
MINSKIVYSIIPARSGSKTIKNKNIYIVNNKPLLYYSIMTSKKSKLIDRTFLLTDSKKYSKIGLKYGAEIPYLRSKGVSGDKTSDVITILDFLKQLKKNKIVLPEYIVHLRPTSPIREPILIDKAIKKFHNFNKYTSLRSVHEMDESAYKTAEIVNNSLVSSFNRNKNMDLINDPRNSFPKTFFTNGYVDVLKTKYIIKYKKIHGNNVYPFKTPDPHDIDNIDKLGYLEYLLK